MRCIVGARPQRRSSRNGRQYGPIVLADRSACYPNHADIGKDDSLGRLRATLVEKALAEDWSFQVPFWMYVIGI